MLGAIIEVGTASAELWMMLGPIIEMGRPSSDLDDVRADYSCGQGIIRSLDYVKADY